MNRITISIFAVLLLLTIPVDAIAQIDPQHETHSIIPVHEITGSSDILGVETRVIDKPVPFNARDLTHLVYEIQVANFDRKTVRLEELEIFSVRDEAVLLKTLGPDELAGAWADFGQPVEDAEQFTLRPGSFTVIYLWLELQRREPVPESLLHRFNFLLPDESDEQRVSILMEPLAVSFETPVVISPPLRGGPWMSWDGPSNQSRHRRALVTRDGRLTPSGRFAIDWFLVRGDTPESFVPDTAGTQNAEILAVADGRIIKVIDGIPDNPLSPPGARAVPIIWETITGNLVILDIGDGRYAYYAHLLEGSIPVKPGDQVRQGDVLGLIGNSGESEGPHLHFEVTNSKVPGQGTGLPFLFKEFELLVEIGFGPDWREHTRMMEPDEQLRRSELPLDRWLIRFPE